MGVHYTAIIHGEPQLMAKMTFSYDKTSSTVASCISLAHEYRLCKIQKLLLWGRLAKSHYVSLFPYSLISPFKIIRDFRRAPN